jgi:cobalamin biosynthesis protein CobD/CbiB
MFIQAVNNLPAPSLFSGLIGFVTAMAALSVASERLTEMIKRFLRPLEAKGKHLKWLTSDWATQFIAIASGIVVTIISRIDPFGHLGFLTSPSNYLASWAHWIASGILVSGGSAFWNHWLDILKAAKVQKEQAVNAALPPVAKIAS